MRADSRSAAAAVWCACTLWAVVVWGNVVEVGRGAPEPPHELVMRRTREVLGGTPWLVEAPEGREVRWSGGLLGTAYTLAGAALAFAALGVARRRQRFAALPGERLAPRPGDALTPGRAAQWTHAVDVEATPEDAWPWLPQIGAGRAGWYSYDRIDNGGVPSLDRIDPGLQDLRAGDVVPAYPGAGDAFEALEVDPPRALVLGWPSGSGQRATFALALEPRAGGARLVARLRIDPHALATRGGAEVKVPRWLVRALVGPGHAVMQWRQLEQLERRMRSPAQAPPGSAPGPP